MALRAERLALLQQAFSDQGLIGEWGDLPGVWYQFCRELAGKHTRGLEMVKESESLPLWVWLTLGLIVVGSAIYVIMAFAIEHMMAVIQ